jgi:hypothetical protein
MFARPSKIFVWGLDSDVVESGLQQRCRIRSHIRHVDDGAIIAHRAHQCHVMRGMIRQYGHPYEARLDPTILHDVENTIHDHLGPRRHHVDVLVTHQL